MLNYKQKIECKISRAKRILKQVLNTRLSQEENRKR